SRARRASRAWASAAGSASQRRALSIVVIRLVVEVALDRGRSQQLLDSLGFIEALVEPEPDVGREFQVDAARNLAAQEALVALEPGEHGFRVAPAKRHDVDGREPQIGRHPHLRDGDKMTLDHRVMYGPARQHVRERMADELTDPQLTLRERVARAGIALMTSAGHDRPGRSSFRIGPRLPRPSVGHALTGEMRFARVRFELTASVAPSPPGSIR